MKGKKFVSGLLSGALILTSVFAFGRSEAEAADTDSLVASYSFEEGLKNDAGEDSASVLVSGLKVYNGTPVYEKGLSGNAIRLDGYGLKLNQENIGEDFSVSMWIKPDDIFKENQVVAFLGYNDPEQWIAVSGGAVYGGSSSECKFWAHDGSVYTGHTTIGTMYIPAGTWHQLTITGSESEVSAYLDGVLVESGKSNHPLDQQNGDIYIGVNNWDTVFSGLVDEIQVYERTLSAEEVEKAYLAEMADPEDDRLSSFEFEKNIADDNGAEASAIVTGLGSFDGDLKYEDGFRGEAIRLGDYGLKLNKQNLGEEFTLSMWVKPDGTFAENQVLTFLGYHSPEKWLAVSGNKSNTAACKFWALGNGYGTHTTIGTGNIESGGWHQLTITGTASAVTAYLDGQLLASGKSNSPLAGENQDIYIGVNNWDSEFSGLVDDVEIYGRALTESEISRIYVSDVINADADRLSVAEETSWDITLPTKGNSGQTTVTWTSDKPEYLNAETGEVTRPAEGQPAEKVTLTAKVSFGNESVEKVFEVSVLPENPKQDLVTYTDRLTLNAGFISSDITLPDTADKANVQWTSSDPSVISETGKVNRPESENKTVTLTATVTLEGAQTAQKKEFPLTVLAKGQDILTYISSSPATGQNGGMKIAGENGDGFSALHNNQPVLYASKGTKSFGAAQIFRKADGSFGVAATDGGNNGNLVFFDSEDLITYSNETLISLPGVSGIDAVNCVYDSADKVYKIFVRDSEGNVWMAESADLTKADSISESSYAFASVEGVPQDAVNPYITALTQAEYDAVIKKFASITNTGVQSPSDIQISEGGEYTLPETVTAEYSDGSTKQLGVEWNADDLAAVDTSVPGTYTVNGTVQRTISYTDPENPLIVERADPYMVYNEDDGYYYFTASYPMVGGGDPDGYDRLVLRRSKTIEGLSDAEEVVIWDENESSELGRFIWAPELHKIGDTWYFISTAGLNTGTGTTFNIRPFMIRCNNPDDMMNPDSWGDPVLVKAMSGDEKNCVNAMSLDMTYFEADGQSYLAWADFTQTGISSIYIATTDPSDPTQLTSPCSVISVPEYSWEYVRATVNEGPAVFKNNGKIYLAFSASGTGSEYCIGMLTADEGADLLNPESWVKSNYPLLTSADFNDEVSGPGHNSFTVDKYGNVIIVYHARPAEIHASGSGVHGGDPLYDPCRYAYLQPVNIAADGSPVLNMTPEQELAEEYMNISVQITVSAEEVEKELTEINVTAPPAKTTYEIGDTFDPEGIQVTAVYSDGSEKDVTENVLFSGYDKNTEGVQTITVSYTENEVTVTGTFEVTVAAAQTEEPDQPGTEEPDQPGAEEPDQPGAEEPDQKDPNTSEPAGDEDGSDAVQTGDTTNAVPAAAVSLLALGCAVTVVIMKRKQKG